MKSKSLKNLWKLFSLSALLMLAACSADDLFDLGDDTWSRQNLSPAITEAREFFEGRIAEADLNGTLDLESFLAPGEVSPVWKNATIVQEGTETRIWVPIESDYSYIVRKIFVFKNGEAAFRTWPIRQVLLISKDELSEAMTASYVTLIPTRDYHMKYRSNVMRNFTQKEKHGDFSGLAIYYDAATMQPWAYKKIHGGEIVFSTDISFCGSEKLFCRSLRAATKSLSFSRVRIIQTKEVGEEMEFIDDGTWASFPCDTYEDDFEPYKFWEQNSVSNTWTFTDTRELFYGITHTSCEWSDSYENSVYAFQNNHYSQSSPSACIPNCLSYLHAIQIGDSSPLTAEQYENNMMTQYQQYAGQNPSQFDGIPTADVASFAAYVGAQWGNFSVTDSYTRSGCAKVQMDYDQIISEGKYILTNVYEANLTNNTMKAHAVIIIGKTNTGKYIYRDPSDSTIYEGNYNQFGSEFDVAIKLN